MSKSAHATHRDLVAALKGQAARTGATTPSVRGSDWRLATVTTVNADGTIIADGLTVRRMETYYNPAVGDVIVIDQNSAGNWLARGRTATEAGTAWISYTPTWTAATTNPTLGNGTLLGRYHKIGRTVHLQINLVAGSTTTFGAGGYSFALPFQAASSGCTYIGGAHLLQTSRYGGQFVISPGATSAAPSFPDSTLTPVTRHTLWDPTHPLTFASGGQIRITVTYESAT